MPGDAFSGNLATSNLKNFPPSAAMVRLPERGGGRGREEGREEGRGRRKGEGGIVREERGGEDRTFKTRFETKRSINKVVG